MINEFAERIQPEINDHILRWKKIQSYDAWLQSVEDLRAFASQRPFLQFQHINSFFNLDGIINVTIRTENESQGFVRLNSLDIHNSTVGIDEDYNRWIGQYFRNIPIKLDAVALPGFKFSHWSGSVESTEQSITVSPEASFYAKAHFVIDKLSTGDLDKIDFMIYPNPVKDELNILSLNTLSDYKLYSLDGRLVKEGVLNNKQMNVSFLPKGIYLLELQIKGKRVVKKLLKN